MPDHVIRLETIGSQPSRWLPERCPKTGKRMFRRKRDAEAQIAEWAQHNDWAAHAYWCQGPANGGDGCGCWHVSRDRGGDGGYG